MRSEVAILTQPRRLEERKSFSSCSAQPSAGRSPGVRGEPPNPQRSRGSGCSPRPTPRGCTFPPPSWKHRPFASIAEPLGQIVKSLHATMEALQGNKQTDEPTGLAPKPFPGFMQTHVCPANPAPACKTERQLIRNSGTSPTCAFVKPLCKRNENLAFPTYQLATAVHCHVSKNKTKQNKKKHQNNRPTNIKTPLKQFIV